MLIYTYRVCVCVKRASAINVVQIMTTTEPKVKEAKVHTHIIFGVQLVNESQ